MKRHRIIIGTFTALMLSFPATAFAQTDSLRAGEDSTLNENIVVEPDPQPEVQPTTIAIETEPAVQPTQPQGPPIGRTLNMLIIACCATMLLALTGCVLGIMNRREINELRRALGEGIDDTNLSLKKLAEETASHVNRLNDQMRYTQRTMRTSAIATPPAHVAPVNAEPQEKTIYAGKPDENGFFTRTGERFELGNSIFELHTTDGRNATFSVIENGDVHRFAMMMPTENLTRACEGENIQRSAGMARIVNDFTGEAILENGGWRIVSKAGIHYE